MAGYKNIEGALRQRILSGEWPVDGLLPGEEELAAEYGASRVTVNRAMQLLAERGLVERKRRAGTRVKQGASRQATATIKFVREEIQASGADYSYTLLSCDRKRPGKSIRADLKLEPKQPALHVLGLHMSDGQPYQLEDRWINLANVPHAVSAPFDTISANEWLFKQVPFTDAQHVFRAAAATPAQAGHLDIQEGEPVFIIERVTWLSQNPITSVQLIHPGQTYRLVCPFRTYASHTEDQINQQEMPGKAD